MTDRRCPDSGKCHHSCYDDDLCWRVLNAAPLSFYGEHWNLRPAASLLLDEEGEVRQEKKTVSTRLVELDTPCKHSRNNKPCRSRMAWDNGRHTWCQACGGKRGVVTHSDPGPEKAVQQEDDRREPDRQHVLEQGSVDPRPATYLYFKPRGKWKYQGRGASIPDDGHELTHRRILELNGGRMPGILGNGEEFTIVVIDPRSWPRMVLATQ